MPIKQDHSSDSFQITLSIYKKKLKIKTNTRLFVKIHLLIKKKNTYDDIAKKKKKKNLHPHFRGVFGRGI